MAIWMAEALKQAHEVTVLTWEPLVCVSRLSTDKNHLRIIEIMRQVRLKHSQLKLRIVGMVDPSTEGKAYHETLLGISRENADWLTVHIDLPRDKVVEFLGRARYGIHLKEDEHFGIAVAEMLRAGMLPFAHRSGGQMEIVRDAALLFVSDAEAVEKITRILEQRELRDRVRRELDRRRDDFSENRFCRELLGWVDKFWKEQSSAV